MRWWMWILVFGGACSGDGKDGVTDSVVGDDDDDDDDDPCAPTQANDLADVYALQRDDENFCESASEYRPSVPTASTHWFSELTLDACGVVYGYEAAYIYPNPIFEENTGIEPCVVYWDVIGEIDDAAVGGTDVGLAVDLELNLVETTCVPNPFEEYVSQSTHYNVAYTGDTTRWFFDSGTEFAAGYGNDSHVSYFFDECKLF